MQIFWAVILIIMAIAIFYAQSKIDNTTLSRLANVAGIISAIAALIVLALYTSSNLPPEGQPTALPENVNTVVIISSLEGWQDTGVFFNKGDRVEVMVISGRWAYAPDQFFTRGEGDTNYICSHLLPSPDCVEPLPEAPKGSLIGKIVNTIFEIGEQVVVIAQDTGYLQLRINDGDYGLSDNTGSLEINISRGD